MAIDANTEATAPPSTHCGIVRSSAENFGIRPAMRRNVADIANTRLATTLVDPTIPTFWLYVAVGGHPKRALIMLLIPYPMIPPFNSLSVGRRSIPPLVVAEKSPIAWIEFTRNKIASGMIADTSKLTPNARGVGICTQPALESAEKSTIPKQSARIYPQISPIRMDASLSSPFP